APIADSLGAECPARIRYTSRSVPYHLGNGQFAGWLPFIATAVVAASAPGGLLASLSPARTKGGNIFVGLLYPIAVAVMTVIIGWLYVRETKDTRIWDEVGGRQESMREVQEAAAGSSLAG